MESNQLPTDPEKRRTALVQRTAFLARMRVQDAKHAALFCPEHANYIGFRGLAPCRDCA